MNEKNEIVVDDEKAEMLMNRIIVMENFNLRTHNKNDQQMISDIQDAIKEAVQCFSKQ